jgi:hypothetical protein
MKRRISAIALLSVASGTLLAPTASAGASDLVVYTSGKSARTLKVCRSWEGTGPNVQSQPCGGGTGYLPRGTNSQTRLGWSDTDGIRVDAGYSLKVDKPGPDSTLAGCRSYTFWRKVSPSLADPGVNEDYYYLWNCPAY